MKDLGTRTIETKRLILRKIENADVDAMYNNWANDEIVSKYVTWSPHKNKNVTKDVIDHWVNEYSESHVYNWIVVEKNSKIPFGTISVIKKSLKDETCEVGYCYGSKWWGKGYATEALSAVIDYLINIVGFYTVEAKHRGNNPASGKVMKKSGMKYEGTLRDRRIDKETGKRDTLIVYSITQNDLIR